MEAASWCKRLGARLPPLGSRVRVSVTPCGFRGVQNGVWVGFSWGFSHFPLPQISFHHFSTLISSILFHFISPCDGASGVVGRHPCYSRTYISGLHRISSLDPTLCWTRVEDILIGNGNSSISLTWVTTLMYLQYSCPPPPINHLLPNV